MINRNYSGKEIAIVGMSGKFTGAKDISSLWNHLINKEHFIFVEKDAETDFIRYNISLDGKDEFDPLFFGYTKSEAEMMDPQIRILHEYVWKALEDAGCPPLKTDKKIGLFASASDNEFWRLNVLSQSILGGASSDIINSSVSNDKFISSLIAYKLNLKGPILYTNTACSSSLVNVHLACRSLLMKECAVAVAAGISATSIKTQGHTFKEGGIFSKDGFCRPFDENASGTIPGEGVGVIVLKRLDDAIKGKDHIYAIIKGSSVTNDGNRKVGYTAPSILGQAECIKSAFKFAQVAPETITFIETHGTGTSLGDSVEFEALKLAFETSNTKCGLGSVKSSIGHLDVASGIVGLIKTSLSLKEKIKLPTLNFNVPNPDLRIDSTPFYIISETEKWGTHDDSILRAGVSSFGIGGTNAHVILEEAPEELAKEKKIENNLFIFSAKTISALNKNTEALKFFISDNNTDLADAAYTMAVGKEEFYHRQISVGETTEELFSNISTVKNSNKEIEEIVFMFPGQGSQYVSMAKELFDEVPFIRKQIELGLDLLEEEFAGEDLKSILFLESDKINNTQYTQPLLFLVEYSIAKWLIQIGVQPTHMIGHSLGEYVAATISGVFEFKDALKLVAKRAKLMNSVKRGSMLAVQSTIEKINEFKFNHIDIAAINDSSSIVLSGEDKAIEECLVSIKSKGIAAMKLTTSHAFHSQMMDSILVQFETILDGVEKFSPKIPFISCSSGENITVTEATTTTYWVEHLRRTVKFDSGVSTLLDLSNPIFIEIGPGNTLGGIVSSAARERKTSVPILRSMRSAKEQSNGMKIFLKCLGEIWMNRIDVDWELFYENTNRKKVPLPSYEFEKNKFTGDFEFNELISKLASFKGLDYSKIDMKMEAKNDTVLARPDFKTKFIAPNSEYETKIAFIWNEIFGIDNIGIQDDFFELGGDSIKALRLSNQLRENLNVELDIGIIYKNPTIEKLAQAYILIKNLSDTGVETKNNLII